GSDITAVVNALGMFPICSLGLNCSTGPTEMGEHIAYLSKHWPRPISVMPNAGLPIMLNGKTSFPLAADGFATALTRFVDEFGIQIVGGCCGTTPQHIAMLVQSLENLPTARKIASREITPQKPGCSSLYTQVEF